MVLRSPIVWGFVTAAAGPDPSGEAAVLATGVAASQVLLLW